jgi:hypothetical protein
MRFNKAAARGKGQGARAEDTAPSLAPRPYGVFAD